MSEAFLQLLERKDLPEGYSRQLGGGRYALDVPLPDALDIDANEMSVVIPFASGERRDNVGDLLEVSGIDLSRHVKNPLVMFDHGQGDVKLPVGMAQNPKTGQYSVEIDPAAKLARGKAWFYQGKGSFEDGGKASKEDQFEHALCCEQLFDMIAKKFIRAGSLGYLPVRGAALAPDYERGLPAGAHLQKTLLLEFGPVILPANGDVVMKLLSGNRLCGKAISPVLYKSLQAHAPERKAQMGWEGKSISDKQADLEKALFAAGEKLAHYPESKALSNPLSRTNVPPARWKPGVGAIKALRKKYKSNGQQDTRHKYRILEAANGELYTTNRIILANSPDEAVQHAYATWRPSFTDGRFRAEEVKSLPVVRKTIWGPDGTAVTPAMKPPAPHASTFHQAKG